MNFSLHSTTGQSSATPLPGAQDLPRLQKPARRRRKAGKIVGHRTGYLRSAIAGVLSPAFPA